MYCVVTCVYKTKQKSLQFWGPISLYGISSEFYILYTHFWDLEPTDEAELSDPLQTRRGLSNIRLVLIQKGGIAKGRQGGDR